MRLRLYENYRFVLYTPFYAAHAIGAYAAEGLTVELLPSPGAGLAEQALLDGTVEVLWAGPMRVMKHHDMNPDTTLVCFAEVVCRDPFSIVGRYPNPGFRLADLSDTRIATVSEVPTPWLCLQEDLRQAGIDPAQLNRIADCSMAENLNAIKRGPDRGGSVFRARRRRSLGLGQGPPMVRSEHGRPCQLHGFRHDPGPARSRRRALIAHGQGDPAGSALDLYPISPRDCRGDRLVLPRTRYRRADRRTRPLPVAVGMGARSGSSRGRL
jgi:hypothetical protein